METRGGDEEWQVDVVLRANGHHERQAEIVDAVSRALPAAREPAQRTSSFDSDPPDGSIGVACWVKAKTAGAALDDALELVRRHAEAIVGERLALWDLRVVPLSAVLDDGVGNPAATTLLWSQAGDDDALA